MKGKGSRGMEMVAGAFGIASVQTVTREADPAPSPCSLFDSVPPKRCDASQYECYPSTLLSYWVSFLPKRLTLVVVDTAVPGMSKRRGHGVIENLRPCPQCTCRPPNASVDSVLQAAVYVGERRVYDGCSTRCRRHEDLRARGSISLINRAQRSRGSSNCRLWYDRCTAAQRSESFRRSGTGGIDKDIPYLNEPSTPRATGIPSALQVERSSSCDFALWIKDEVSI